MAEDHLKLAQLCDSQLDSLLLDTKERGNMQKMKNQRNWKAKEIKFCQ